LSIDDGADLVRDCTYLSCGVKVTDENGYHPPYNQTIPISG